MSDRDRHVPEKFGVPLKYDSEFRGPQKRRSCTDIICLFLFVAFLAAWGFVGFYAYKRGDPEKILKPTDSNGRKCGVDSEVLNKPYLFYFDITKCADPTVIINGCNTPQVCVEKCPDHGWNSDVYIQNQRPFDLNDVRNNLICLDEKTKNGVTNLDNLKYVIDNGLCASWYITSYPSLNRCFPMHQELDSKWVKSLPFTDPILLLTDSIKQLESLAYTQEVGTEIYDDLTKSWKFIVLALGIAIVVSLIYISLLRWIAGIMTWLSILALLALSITGTIFSYKRYEYLKKYGPPPVKNKMIVGTLEEWSYTPELWLAIAIILGILAVIILLLVIFLRRRIIVAIALIKEGSKAVSSIITSLFFPLIPWVLQCAVVVWVLAVLCYLMSIGKDVFKVQGLSSSCICTDVYEDLQNGDICEPRIFQQKCSNPQTSLPCVNAGCNFVLTEKENIVTYFEIFNAFGFFWGIWYISGLSQMILAGAFATWYWTFHKRNVPFFILTESAGRTVRYHLGTIAFASLIISICSFIRAVLEYVENKLKKYENDLVKAIFCCCKCFFWCLERFLRFINRNAYIMCAIHGKNFCTSAGDAFNLLMRNAVRVVVLDKVTDFLFFVGKLVITGCMVAGSYYLFVKTSKIEFHYNGATPLVVIAIGSYIIASIFFGVYSMAVDTLFLCFLEDCERNDGSSEKPYYMSKNLMKILGKRNMKTN